MITYDIDKINKEHLKITLRYARKNDIYYDDEIDHNSIDLHEKDVDDIIEGLKLLKEKQKKIKRR